MNFIFASLKNFKKHEFHFFASLKNLKKHEFIFGTLENTQETWIPFFES